MRDELLADLAERYTPESYNLFRNNCNTFSDELAQLLCGVAIPRYITGEARRRATAGEPRRQFPAARALSGVLAAPRPCRHAPGMLPDHHLASSLPLPFPQCRHA